MEGFKNAVCAAVTPPHLHLGLPRTCLRYVLPTQVLPTQSKLCTAQSHACDLWITIHFKVHIESLGVLASDKASVLAVVMLQAPKGATQSAGVVVEQSAGCMYVKVNTWHLSSRHCEHCLCPCSNQMQHARCLSHA